MAHQHVSLMGAYITRGCADDRPLVKRLLRRREHCDHCSFVFLLVYIKSNHYYREYPIICCIVESIAAVGPIFSIVEFDALNTTTIAVGVLSYRI